MDGAGVTVRLVVHEPAGLRSRPGRQPGGSSSGSAQRERRDCAAPDFRASKSPLNLGIRWQVSDLGGRGDRLDLIGVIRGLSRLGRQISHGPSCDGLGICERPDGRSA